MQILDTKHVRSTTFGLVSEQIIIIFCFLLNKTIQPVPSKSYKLHRVIFVPNIFLNMKKNCKLELCSKRTDDLMNRKDRQT